MKLIETFNLENLTKYGFEKIDKEEERECENDTLCYFEYKYTIGHSRRGQYYYILISNTKSIYIYANEADGDGSYVELPEVILKMCLDNIIINE